MKINILFFATLKDRAGVTRTQIDLPGEAATLEEARAALRQRFPTLVDHLGVAVAAINQEFAFSEDTLHEGDELAFFPPVSGGTLESETTQWPEIYRVASEPLDLNELVRAITSPQTGAVCFFSGAVRGETVRSESHEVTAPVQTVRLEYEAYEPMALAKMRQVAMEIREQWPLVQGIAIVQRVGRLEVGEPTVLIACASAHRDQGCFEAARYGIDRLKEIVPVWKKEIGPQADRWIEGHYTPTPEDRVS